jgi:REP element-mobilizing transposase RayT
MTQHRRKSHNVSLILYHLVCPVKCRQKVFHEDTEDTLKNICWSIEQHYEIIFVEIGADEDHVHFLIQSVPTYSPTKIARIIKSITGREMFDRHPELLTQLWNRRFWTSGFYINTVGKSGNEEAIKKYVKNQGRQYSLFHRTDLEEQPALFSY